MLSPAPAAAFETLHSSCLCAVLLIKVFKCVLTTSLREYLNATEVGG